MILTVLGKRDFPTDGVEDYCRLLSGALEKRGMALALVRVRWDEIGWLRALRDLRRREGFVKGEWALVQYTALAWSSHGFPLRFLMVLAVLWIRKCRVAVVFHDPEPYPGKRPVDRLRRVCQRFIMRGAYRLSSVSILNVPLEKAFWLPRPATKAAFVPIGANVPGVSTRSRSPRYEHKAKTITVFALGHGGATDREVSDIARAAKMAAEQVPRIRLVTLGRGSLESESRLRHALEGSPVQYNAFGILPPEEVSQILADSDVSLFVRSRISSQRGSAIASIANAVPLIAYADQRLPNPLSEAGVVGVPYLDAEELAAATVRILTDPQLWCKLHERSRRAHKRYFAWEAVASRLLDVLSSASPSRESTALIK